MNKKFVKLSVDYKYYKVQAIIWGTLSIVLLLLLFFNYKNIFGIVLALTTFVVSIFLIEAVYKLHHIKKHQSDYIFDKITLINPITSKLKSSGYFNLEFKGTLDFKTKLKTNRVFVKEESGKYFPTIAMYKNKNVYIAFNKRTNETLVINKKNNEFINEIINSYKKKKK